MTRNFSVKSMLISICLFSLTIILSTSVYRYSNSKTVSVAPKVEQAASPESNSNPKSDSTHNAVAEANKNTNVEDSSNNHPFKLEQTLIKDAKGLSKDVLHLALKAYYNASAENGIENHKLTIIDYSKPSDQKRMWVIDMDKKKVDLNTYVSHGVKSGDKIAKSFSNKMESHKTSIGVMKTGSIYTGKSGMSLHLHGLEDEFNNNVYQRHVVIHGSNYVNDAIIKKKGKIGKSFGCPAVDRKIAKPLIQKIANGSLVFAYYPLQSWLKSSEYLM